MGWLRRLFRTPAVLGIAEETLAFVCEAAEDTHPNEYMGLLRGRPLGELVPEEDFETLLGRDPGLEADPNGLVITDVLVIPGTESSPVSATVKEHMIPNDRRTAGSVHSHPNGVLRPSDADLGTFGRGAVHLILGPPYDRDSWRAFDEAGEQRRLAVLDVEVPAGEDFFDFDQSDIDAELRGEDSRW